MKRGREVRIGSGMAESGGKVEAKSTYFEDETGQPQYFNITWRNPRPNV